MLLNWNSKLDCDRLFQRYIDCLPLTVAVEAKIVIQLHLPLLWLQAQLSPEVDRDWDCKGAPARELHLEFIARVRLNVHIVHTESRMQAKSDFFNHPISVDVLAHELDKHGPLVRVPFVPVGRHSLMPVAVDQS